MDSPISAPKNPRKLALVAIAALAMVLAGAYFLMPRGVDAVFVENRLRAAVDVLNANAQAQGYGLRIAYGSVTTEGGLFSRHAVIKDPSIEFNDSAGQTRISTAHVTVEAASVNLRRLRYTFTDPITVEEGGRKTATINYSRPLIVEVEQIPEGDSFAYEYDMHLAPENSVVQQTPNGPLNYTLKLAENHTIKGRISTTGPQNVVLRASGIRVEEPTGLALSIGKLDFSGDDQPAQGKKRDVNYVIDLAEVQIPALAAYGPVNFSTELHYIGETISTSSSPASQEEASLSIKKIVLQTKDTTLSLNGEVNKTKGELFPIGKLVLEIKNFAFVMKTLDDFKVFKDASARETWLKVVGKMLGQDPAGMHDVSLAITHDKGGSIYVGHVTVEELLAMALGQNSALVPIPGTPLSIVPPGAPSSAPPPATPIPAPAAPAATPAPVTP